MRKGIGTPGTSAAGVSRPVAPGPRGERVSPPAR